MSHLPTLSNPAQVTPQSAQWSPSAVRPLVRHWLNSATTETAQWLQRCLLLLPLYALFRVVYFPLTKLPEASYFQPSITLASLGNLPSLALWGVTAIWVWQTICLRWTDLGSSTTLRNLVLFFVGVLTWTFSLYDLNLYYNQTHIWDRLLLIGLGVAVWFRPGLLSPWLMLVYLIAHQLDHPLPCTWTDKRAMFDALTLCQTYLVLLVWLRQPGTTDHERWLPFGTLFCTLCCLQASNYFYPGLAKILLGWPLVERLDNLFIASWLNGWWGNLSESQALGWAALMADWNWFLVGSSLVVELIVIAAFWKRWLAVVLWINCIGLHAMICLTTGILFWKWMLLDAAIIAVLLLHRREEVQSWFTRPVQWISVGLILGAPLVFQPIWLAWYDTELNDHYHLQAVTSDGSEYWIPRTSLTPQEVYFAQNKFHFLVPELRFVVGRYGTTPDAEVMRRLDGSPTRDSAEAVCKELGDTAFSERKAADFDRFIQRFFAMANQHPQRTLVPHWLQAPQHIYSWTPSPALPITATVREVRVVHVRALYQRDRIETLRNQVVRVISIPRDTNL